MQDRQNSKPCGGNVFIFSSILFCIFAIVLWLFVLLFDADSKQEQHQSLPYSRSEPYQAVTNKPGQNSAIYKSKINQLQNELSIQQQKIIQLTRQNEQLKTDQDKISTKLGQQLSSLRNSQISNIRTTEEQVSQQQEESNTRLVSVQQKLSNTEITLSRKQQELDTALDNLDKTRQLSGQQLIEIKNREKELATLKKQLSNTDIQISDLKNRFTVFEIKQEILFNEGEAQLNKNGKHAISTLAKIFRQFPDRQIAIQGHTDNQKLGKTLKQKFTSNWELAAARSASAIHYLQNVEKISPERMILVSYSQYRPIRSNASAQGQANNRRIEVILMPEDFGFFRETTS